MDRKESLELARRIMTTGKFVRERVDRIQSAHLARRGECGAFGEMSAAQLSAVLTIRNRGQVSIGELSTLLGVSAPSASAMVERLVEKGVLTREPSRRDRRRVVVRVSSAAMGNIEKVEEVILQAFADIVERIGPGPARQWCQVLQRVKGVLEDDLRPV